MPIMRSASEDDLCKRQSFPLTRRWALPQLRPVHFFSSEASFDSLLSFTPPHVRLMSAQVCATCAETSADFPYATIASGIGT
jgi:hypothetical protein